MSKTTVVGILLLFSIGANASGPTIIIKDKHCMTEMKSAVAKSNNEAEFRDLVITFLEAVKNRNGKKVMEFVRGDLPMTHVLPRSKILTDVEAYSNSQRNWHEGTTGTWTYKIHSIESTSEMGLASIFADYDNLDSVTGNPFHLELYISYLFRKVDGKWYMVHSQNSVLKEVR